MDNKFILDNAKNMGYDVASLSSGEIIKFVGCVLLNVMSKSLPDAIKECIEKRTKKDEETDTNK